MAITLSNTFTAALLAHDATGGQSAIADQVGGGTFVAYASGGSPPAGPNEAASGTVLATWTFSAASAQGTPAAGSMSLAFSSQTVTAGNNGTADYFRVLNSSGTALIQGTIGVSGADWNISSTTVTSGDQMAITGTGTISWVTS